MSWTIFKAGKYRLKSPKAPGLYPVAALDGGFRGYVEVLRFENTFKFIINGCSYREAHHAHAGYWWSVPVPLHRNANEDELAREMSDARLSR